PVYFRYHAIRISFQVFCKVYRVQLRRVHQNIPQTNTAPSLGSHKGLVNQPSNPTTSGKKPWSPATHQANGTDCPRRRPADLAFACLRTCPTIGFSSAWGL